MQSSYAITLDLYSHVLLDMQREAPPIIILAGSILLLAWTGTGTNHLLNIMPIDFGLLQLTAG
jgi:hypothetical protein